jgi:hypothetical protein
MGLHETPPEREGIRHVGSCRKSDEARWRQCSQELASSWFEEGSAPMPSAGLSAWSVGSVAVKG